MISPADVLYLIVPLAFVFCVGVYFKSIERRAQTLAVSEEFREEYARVVYTWLHKPFPTW